MQYGPKTFLAVESGELEEVTGYWAEDEDTGEVGFLDEAEDSFWVFEEEEQ